MQERLEDMGRFNPVNPVGVVAGVVAMLGPWTLQWLIGQWSYVAILPGVIAAAVFLFRFVYNWINIRQFRALMAPEKLIARWEITREQWEAVADVQYRKNRRFGLYLFIAFVVVFWGIGIAGLFGSDAMGRFVGIIAAVPLTALFWWGLVARRLSRLRNRHVALSRAGMVVNGRILFWEGGKGLVFHRLYLMSEPVPYLDIAYGFPLNYAGYRGSRSGGDAALIPVPPGWELQAQEAITILSDIG